MRDLYLGLKFAISYFTILPIGFKKSDNLMQKNVLRTMIFCFPLVGLLLGVLVLFSYLFVLESLGFIGAIISATLYMLLYGFIHTEAVIDVVDAIYAKHSGKDPYIVIKEPTIGAMGALYGGALFLTKVSLIAYLFYNSIFLEFLAILLVSRFSLVLAIWFNGFRSSFINEIKGALSKTTILASLASILVIGIFILDFHFLFYIFVGVVVMQLIVKSIGRRLGFCNGDVLGASLEISEVVLFLGVALWV